MSGSERDALHVWVGGDLQSLTEVLSGCGPDDGPTLVAEWVGAGAWKDEGEPRPVELQVHTKPERV